MWAAFGWLTVFRVPGSASARGVLPWAPLVGLVLGALAALVGWLAARSASPWSARCWRSRCWPG
ncbi:adenosylcobinamide-GDP ribazoletransferase [Klenkia terrae]|uniref:adenosylcobinamide-GDP ribazoletransferase n=1 Tax=Klenkia terrae TaxID=1052259 RepID=UPI00361980AE